MYKTDNRTVVTLDAGGTNFVFGAIRGNDFIIEPITLPAYADNLDKCIGSLTEGFARVIDSLDDKPVAISFAFPGPADYPNGIIHGYLPNFPSFREGVALGPLLEKRFGLPVFINNDGDLFACGEAICGFLPEINSYLERAGSVKRYKNLIGFTLGTGFGFGLVINGKVNLGDNSCIEIFCLRHKLNPEIYVEEGVSIMGIKRSYAELTGNNEELTPRDIYDIALGNKAGDAAAARRSFEIFGEVAGDAIAITAALTDAMAVIGGGITGARELYMPSLLSEMRSTICNVAGEETARLPLTVFDLDDESQWESFARGEQRALKIYGSNEEVIFDPLARIGVATSRIGATKAISLGAYAFALDKIDGKI